MDDFLFANLLRGIITNILNIILMFSLCQLKYSKKVTIISLTIICTFIIIENSYFYIFYDLTTLARFDIAIWLLVGFVCKILCTDSFMKWMFNVVTVINVFFVIVVISYVVSRSLPYPMYSNTVVRIILYVIFIILFKKFVYNIYQQMVDRWYPFLSITVAIMLNFAYIVITSQNITETIRQNLIPILLMTCLMVIVYVTMLWSFQSIIRGHKLCIEKEQMRLHEDLLLSQLAAYEEFVEASKRYRHDLRHHNQIIMEYLKSGDIKGAEGYLCLYDASLTESYSRNYCQNYIANAVLCLYAQKAKAEEILFEVKADISENVSLRKIELGSMLSNILENALEACLKTKFDKRFITFRAEIEEDNLKIEIKNTVDGNVKIRNNLPISTKNNGGIGTKSVLYIVESYHGMLNFRQEDDIFITQIILPI